MSKILDINTSLQIPNMVFKSDVDNTIKQITDKASGIPFVQSDVAKRPVYNYDGGIEFDGVDDYLVGVNNVDYGTDDFTIILGLNITSVYSGKESGIIDNRNVALTAGLGIYIDSTDRMFLQYRDGGTLFGQQIHFELGELVGVDSVFFIEKRGGEVRTFCTYPTDLSKLILKTVRTGISSVGYDTAASFNVGRIFNGAYLCDDIIRFVQIRKGNYLYDTADTAGSLIQNPNYKPFTFFKRFQSKNVIKEFNTTPSACSDPNGNEADNVGNFVSIGLDGTGANVFESQNVVVSSGTYALKADANDTQLTGARFYLDISTLGLVEGWEYTIYFKARHVGVGGLWAFRLAETVNILNNPIKVLSSSDVTYATYSFTFTYSSLFRYFGAREISVTNDGGVYLDNLSIVGKALNAKKLFLTSNYLEGAVIDSANQITSIKNEISGELSSGSGINYTNKGLLFDGTGLIDFSSDRLDCTDTNVDNDFTLSQWVTIDETTTFRILCNWNATLTKDSTVSAVNKFNVFYSRLGTNKFGFRDTVNGVDVSGISTPIINKYYHITLVLSSGIYYFFIDGVLETIYTPSTPLSMFEDIRKYVDIAIGKIGAYWKGYADDLFLSIKAVYNPTGYSVGDKVFEPPRRKSFDDKFIQYPIP